MTTIKSSQANIYNVIRMKKRLSCSCWAKPVSNNDMAGIGDTTMKQQIRELAGPRAPRLFKSHQLPATRLVSPRSTRGPRVARRPSALLGLRSHAGRWQWQCFLAAAVLLVLRARVERPDRHRYCFRYRAASVRRRDPHSSLKPAETTNITSTNVDV